MWEWKAMLALPAHDLRRALPRLVLSLAAALFAAWVFGSFGWVVQIVAAWSGLSLTQLGLSWWIIASSTAEETQRWVEEEDPARQVTTLFIVFANLVSLLLTIYLLRHLRTLPGVNHRLMVGLCLTAVLVSWFSTHTTYTAHYAHRYYRDGGGLNFPENVPPAFWDFAYFAFTLGMCFQVSDVTIGKGKLRRIALGHALLSFFFNTSILALALNAVAELGA